MRNRYLIALVAALGLLPVSLDATIVNVATVPISKALQADVDIIQWLFLGYMLSNAAVVPLSGYLGSRYGNKRLFQFGTAFFALMSLLCGLTGRVEWLIALRVLQGIAGGLLIPLGMAIAMDPFTEAERAKAMAVVGVPMMLAPVVGPIVGGLIIEHLNWQSIFFVNVPIGLLVLLLGWWLLPSDADAAGRPAKQSSADYLGLLLSMAGVAVLVYAFKLVSQANPATRSAANPQGAIYGWGYWPVWALAGAGVAMLAIFAYRSLRSDRDPILDLRLFARRDFTAGNLLMWLSSTMTFGLLFLLPVFLQSVHQPRLSPVETGVALLPLGIGTVVGVLAGGGLYRRTGARPLIWAGIVLLALGCWQFRSLTPETTTGALVLPLLVVGLSFTLILVPTNTLALASLQGEALNKASSLVNASKLLVASVGSAALVTVYMEYTSAHAATLTGARAQIAMRAATMGMVDVFTLLLWSTLLLAAVALFLPGRKESI